MYHEGCGNLTWDGNGREYPSGAEYPDDKDIISPGSPALNHTSIVAMPAYIVHSIIEQN
jgi:hypothetical protein